jgi:plasmid stability protein
VNSSARKAQRSRPDETISYSDIVLGEGVIMEQMLVRNLPDGTKAALRARAVSRGRSAEAEARQILTAALAETPANLADLLGMPDDGIDFEPERLGLRARDVEL